MSARRPPCETGFALLIVLWSVALLALLGSTVTAAGRGEARIAADGLTAARAQTAADGAIWGAAFHLLGSAAQHWPADGAPHRLLIGETQVTVVIEDQRGRIDVNNVPPALVAALLARLGVAGTDAGTLANAIADWRSPADTGLAARYAAQGRRYAPPHASFESLDELALVLGVTPALLDRAKPHLSLYLEQAPQSTLADPAVAGALADLAHASRDSGADDEPGPLVARVTATARNGTTTARRVAVMRIAEDTDRPFQLLEWNGG